MATKKNTKTEAEIQQALEVARGRGKKVAATVPAIISPKPNTKPLTQRQERLLKTAAEIGVDLFSMTGRAVSIPALA